MGAQTGEIIPFVAQKIAAFRAQGQVVIFVCDAHTIDDPEFGAFPAHAVKGSWGAGIIPELTPASGDLRVEKTRHSAFDRTNLDYLLQKEPVEEVHLVGVLTSICVLSTVKDLVQRKLPGLVYRQGVADSDPEVHAAALKEMQQVLGAQVVS